MNIDTFYTTRVLSAQCIIGTENSPDSAILLNFKDDDYSQGYVQIKGAFQALTQDDILQPFISEHDFRSSNDGDFVGHDFYAFEIRYQKIFESAQAIK